MNRFARTTPLVVALLALGTFALPAAAQNFTATVSPQPIAVTRGIGSQAVTVSTSGAHTAIREINYSFDRLPSGVGYTPASQITTGAPFPAVTFTFSASAGAAPGTYPILLNAVPNCGTVCPPGVSAQTIPVSLLVQQSDIAATFAQNPMQACPSGPPVSNSVTLHGMNGYSGTPSVFFESIPSGIAVNPTTFSPPPIERGAPVLPFSVQAAGAPPGTYVVNLRVIDRAAGVDRTLPLQIQVAPSDYTPSISPLEVAVVAGGGAEAISVSLAPISCFTEMVSVTASAPAGIRVTPASFTLAPPYSPTSVSLQALPGTPAGTYNVAFSYVSAGGTSKNASVAVRVSAAPDYELRVSPPAISLAPGQSESVNVCVSPLNGLSGNIGITSPTHPALTFTPSSFSATDGCTTVVVTAGGSVASQTAILSFQGHHPVAGGRTAPLTIIISGAPDFALTATPPVLVIAAGTSGTVNITATGVNGFTGPINVTLDSIANVSFSPAAFSLQPGTSQSVSVVASAGSPATTTLVTATGVGSGVAGARTTSFEVAVIATPDFTLSADLETVSLAPGQSREINVTATGINGFTGLVNVTASAPGVAIITPSSFAITAGSTQRVTLTVPASAPAGAFQITFSGTSAGVPSTRVANVVVQVTTVTADFSLGVAPSAISIAAGSSAPISLSVLFGEGTPYPVQVTTSAAAAVNVSPSTLTFNTSGTQSVMLTVPAGSAGGMHIVTFSAQGNGRTRSGQVAVTVPQRDFALVLTPATVAIAAGEASAVVVSLSPASSNDIAVDVVVTPVSNVNVTPPSFRVTSAAPATVVITAAADAPATLQIAFTGTADGITRGATLAVRTLPRNPAVHSISPPTASVASRSAVVLLTGSGFAPGAIVTSPRPGIVVDAARVIAPTLAEVAITFHGDAVPGRYPLALRNADGGTSTEDVALLVYPADALGGPVGVTTAAIVFPAGGTFVAEDEAVYTRGLLATTGTGTIFGQWQLDGIPFDIFTATVSGGMPTEVRSHVPIPARTSGPHTLELVVRSPQYAISPSITLVQTLDTASRLTLLAPSDGSVVASGQTFRWSLVPGASGYEMEVDHAEEVLPRMVRVSDAEWSLTPFEARRLGTGVRRWRVRPVLAGDTRGEPTRWSRFVVLPESVVLSVLPARVDSSTGRHHVRWTGGYPGLLYQVEFREPDGSVAFRALTIHQEYVLPLGASDRLQRLGVRVTPLGPNGAAVGESNAAPMPVSQSGAKGLYRFAQSSMPPRIVRQEPAEGASVTSSLPLLRAEWSASVDPDTVAIVIDDVDVTAVSDVTPTSIRHQTLLPLASGAHVARVTAGTLHTEWRFTVAEPVSAATSPVNVDDAPAQGSAAAPDGARPGARRDWTAMPIGSVAATSGPTAKDEARAQISGQADIATFDQSGVAKFSGDLSLARQLEQPNETLTNNRNWLTRFGAKQPWVGEDIAIGYNIPSIFDQAQLLTLGLARGGAMATVSSRIGSVSYYEAFDSNAGAAATFINPRQDVRAFAYETPFNRDRVLIRLVRLDAEEEAGTFTSGGTGRSLGVFTRFTLGRATTLIVEAAHGEFTADQESLEQTREGNAMSLRLDGYFGRVAYRAHVRSTDATFVNPANRGLTPASVADRQGADVSLMRMFGTSVVTADVRYLTGGNSSGLSAADGREGGGKISLANFSLGRRFTLGGSVNMTNSRAGEISIYVLPATDRTLRGSELTIATSGRIQLSQSISYQETVDNITALNGSSMTNLTFAVNGMPAPNITLSAIASGIRSAPDNPLAGQTDMLVVSINPAFAIPAASLSLRPSITFARSENSAYQSFITESLSYAAGVNWSPQWFGNLLSLQVSSTWSEIKTPSIRTETDPTYSATLTLRKAVGRGPAAANGTTLPGATPIAIPEAATTNPIQGTTPATTNPK